MQSVDAARQLQAVLGRMNQGVSFDLPETMSDRDVKQKEWELRRLEEEISAWERPRQYETPEGAVQPIATGPLTEEEMYAQPAGPKGVITPQFTKETGIFVGEDGRITNVGPQGDISRPTKKGYEQDENSKQRYMEALQKREAIKQSLAQHKSGLVNIPGRGMFERGPDGKIGKKVADEPAQGDWTKTKEGAQWLAKNKPESDKLTGAAKVDYERESKRYADLQDRLSTGTILDPTTGVPRAITEEERKQFQADLATTEQNMDRIAGRTKAEPSRGAPKPSGFGGNDADKRVVMESLNQVEAIRGNRVARGLLSQVQAMIRAGKPGDEIKGFLDQAVKDAKHNARNTPSVDEALAPPPIAPGPAEQPPIQAAVRPRGRGGNAKKAGFDPEGSSYDMGTAKSSGMKPRVMDDGKPHWGSVGAPLSAEAARKAGVPQGSQMLLKGRQHDTWDKAIRAEEARGSEVIKGKDGRYYAVRPQTPGRTVDDGLINVESPSMPGRPTMSPAPPVPLGAEITPEVRESEQQRSAGVREKVLGPPAKYLNMGPNRVNQMTSGVDMGDPFKSAKASMENVAGYAERVSDAFKKGIGESKQRRRDMVLSRAKQIDEQKAKALDTELVERLGDEYFNPNTLLINPEAVPVMIEVAKELGFTDQQIAQIMGQ